MATTPPERHLLDALRGIVNDPDRPRMRLVELQPGVWLREDLYEALVAEVLRSRPTSEVTAPATAVLHPDLQKTLTSGNQSLFPDAWGPTDPRMHLRFDTAREAFIDEVCKALVSCGCSKWGACVMSASEWYLVHPERLPVFFERGAPDSDPRDGWFAPDPDNTVLDVMHRIAKPFAGEPWADKVLSLESEARQPVDFKDTLDRLESEATARVLTGYAALRWDTHRLQFTEAVRDLLVSCGCEKAEDGDVEAPNGYWLVLVGAPEPFYDADADGPEGWFAPGPDDTPLDVARRIAMPFKGERWAEKVLALVTDPATGCPVSPREVPRG